MKIRMSAFNCTGLAVLITVPCFARAQQPEWLMDLAAHVPQFIVRASPISRQGNLSPDGKWLVTDYDLDANIDLGQTIADRLAVRILDRTGKVVQEVTRDNPRFLSVRGGVWGKDSNTLYFEYGSRMRPGNRGDVLDGPVIYRADLGTGEQPTPCTKTAFTQMPIWSPHGDSYLITERDRSSVKLNGSGERYNVVLTNIKRKTRIKFHDAEAPAWSPDNRWILLVNLPPDRQDPYLRFADSRSGKERALTATMSSEAENRRYGWTTATLEPLAVWLADSMHLLMGVSGKTKDGAAFEGCFVTSVNGRSRSFVPNVHPLSGSRNGRTLLIERPDKKLFLLDIFPKRWSRERLHGRSVRVIASY